MPDRFATRRVVAQRNELLRQMVAASRGGSASAPEGGQGGSGLDGGSGSGDASSGGSSPEGSSSGATYGSGSGGGAGGPNPFLLVDIDAMTKWLPREVALSPHDFHYQVGISISKEGSGMSRSEAGWGGRRMGGQGGSGASQPVWVWHSWEDSWAGWLRVYWSEAQVCPPVLPCPAPPHPQCYPTTVSSFKGAACCCSKPRSNCCGQYAAALCASAAAWLGASLSSELPTPPWPPPCRAVGSLEWAGGDGSPLPAYYPRRFSHLNIAANGWCADPVDYSVWQLLFHMLCPRPAGE